MDFFAHQERARRQTTRLVVLFGLAVAGIVAAIYAVLVAISGFAEGGRGGPALWQPQILLWSAAGTLLVVGLGSLYKTHQLSSGGAALATLLGGREIAPNTGDRGERTLVNVVEEMAIASGIPAPAVYVLDGESGINAFAAGFAPSDAVIGVTRGCVDQLTRDELQGVIAHEFSHIFHGDMRLNLRLIGVLHGIVCIALAGYVILRSGAGFRHRGSKSRGAGGVLLFGVSLVAIGSIGMLFARLIQAAVSRQREYLADASAVQYTRQASGIAGALKKIGGYAAGSRLHSAQARGTSHIFFGNALKPALFASLATHPPLEERIRRIEGSFDPEKARAAAADLPAGAAGFAGAAAPTPAALLAQAGKPTDAHLSFTRELLGSLPLSVRAALHEPFHARALVLALLLDRDGGMRRQQLERLRALGDPATLHETSVLAQDVSGLDRALRLPLVDLAIPALSEMSAEQGRRFAREVQALVEADQQIDLFEFALQKVLLRHLGIRFGTRRPAGVRYHSLHPLLDDCQTLLSRLARAGHDDAEEARAAYERGLRALPSDGYRRAMAAATDCDLAAVDKALDRLARATPRHKQLVLAACGEAVAHDGIVRSDEVELLRAVADTLDCPLPPLLLPQREAVAGSTR